MIARCTFWSAECIPNTVWLVLWGKKQKYTKIMLIIRIIVTLVSFVRKAICIYLLRVQELRRLGVS